jgi:hypothetical protein
MTIDDSARFLSVLSIIIYIKSPASSSAMIDPTYNEFILNWSVIREKIIPSKYARPIRRIRDAFRRLADGHPKG